MSQRTKKLFKSHKSLDRTMSIDSNYSDERLACQNRMSLDSAPMEHLWAHGCHGNMQSGRRSDRHERSKDQAQFRRYIVLQRITRRSWPSTMPTSRW